MPEFTLNRNHRLVSLTGHTIQFVKDEPVFVPQECKTEAIAIGAQPTDGNTDVLADEVVVVELTAEEREEQLIKAFKTLQGRNERGDFTGQGIPAIPALKKLVEFSPEKKEVETLWTHFIEEQASA